MGVESIAVSAAVAAPSVDVQIPGTRHLMLVWMQCGSAFELYALHACITLFGGYKPSQQRSMKVLRP